MPFCSINFECTNIISMTVFLFVKYTSKSLKLGKAESCGRGRFTANFTLREFTYIQNKTLIGEIDIMLKQLDNSS